MPLRRLTWIFGGLFVAFGVPLVLSEGVEGRRFWAGLSTLCLGGFGVSMARDALATGQIRLQTSVIRRAARPRLFWAAVVLVAAAGVGVLITGFWFLFFKN
jgi:hypothetical protein